MSDTDSFINEVSEEVRRDQLFKLMKKYGWIAIALVVLLVGGAAFNEWSKAKSRTQAEALGDAILTAFQIEDPASRQAALEAIETDGDRAAILNSLVAAEALQQDGGSEDAILRLRSIVSQATLPITYRHLAELKLILIQGDNLPTTERMSRLELLATPGAPYRLLAEEQMGLIDVSTGNVAGAIARFQGILDDGESVIGMRRRLSQLVVALGGDPNPA